MDGPGRASSTASATRRTPSIDPATPVAVIAGVAAFALAMAPSRLSYSYDESVTIGTFVREGLTTPFTKQVVHNNHPLFSFFEHLAWRAGATDEWAFRVLPALFFAGTAGLVGRWCTRRWGTVAGIAAAAVMVSHPMALSLGRHARGYTVLLFVATVSTLVLVRIIEGSGGRGWSVLYVAAIAAGTATHLYMAFVVLSHVGLLVERHRMSPAWVARWAIGLGSGALAYVAIPPSSIRRGFHPDFPLQAVWEILGSSWPALIVLGGCAAACVAADRRDLLMIVLPALAIIGLWLALRPEDIYPRFLVWLVPGVAGAAGWTASRWPAVVPGIAVAVVAMLIVSVPASDSGLRDAAALADRAGAAGWRVCAIGGEALLAYTSPPPELLTPDRPCDLVIQAGSWWPAGLDDTLRQLPVRRRVGAVELYAIPEVAPLLPPPSD